MSVQVNEKVANELLDLVKDVMPEIEEDITLSANMIEAYGVNSISLIRLIVAIENKFDVSFTDYELSLDEYASFNDLAAVISEKIEAKDE